MGFLSDPIGSISDTVSHVGKVVAESPIAKTALTVGGAMFGVPPMLTAGLIGLNSGTQNSDALGKGLIDGISSYSLGNGLNNMGMGGAEGATGMGGVNNVIGSIADNPLGAASVLAKPLITAVAGNAAGSGATGGGGGPATGGNTVGSLSDLATQQGTANQNAALWNTNLNRVDQVNPNGSLTWTTDPTTGKQVQTVALSPQQQAIRDSLGGAITNKLGQVTDGMGKTIDTSALPGLNGIAAPKGNATIDSSWLQANRVTGPQAAAASQPASSGGGTVNNYYSGGAAAPAYQAPAPVAAAPAAPADDGTVAKVGGNGIRDTFDTSGVPALPTTIDDTSRQRVEQALMDRLNPQLQKDNDALRSRLLNSGIEVGTDAYNREMNNFAMQSNDARMAAILNAGQEETRQTTLQQGLNKQGFDQSLAQGQFGQNADTTLAQLGTNVNISNAGNATNIKTTGMNNAAQLGAAGINAGAMTSVANINNSGALERLNAQLDQQAQQFNVDTGFKAADYNLRANNQDFTQGLAAGTFNNATRAQGIQEQAFLNNQPLQQLGALNSIYQGTTPTFNSYYTGGNAAAAPILDAGIAQNNYNLGLATNAQNGQNAMYGGLAGIGGALINNPGVVSGAWDWLSNLG